MPNLFLTIRNSVYCAVLVAAIVVLGLAANFATIFLPHLHRPYVIFSLVVSATTIVLFLLILLRSQARAEVFFLFVMDILWLAMAAYTTDVIGPVECFPLGGQRTPTKSGSMSLQTYCYEMKAVEAFSWAVFGIFTIWLILLICLLTKLTARGHYRAWEESVNDLPWFGQDQLYGGGYPQQMYAGAQFGGAQPYVIQQAPGHSMVIQPNANGGPPMVTQLPGTVRSGI
ncbi:hypothetical protein BD410DRAFT_25686 [Rickenella mellea]|uniref:MARVEL domain-containing protein n=1 Tax=Rickenella mellea TaxID=50990 RepID=A0A4R5XEN8_9AGAM|nr:hypothetical protein BD410DRAFT_25686 [Rickenella mellea]